MNPFIINSKNNNHHYLPFQMEGRDALFDFSFNSIKSKRLTRLIIPQGHSLKISWLCGLLFDDARFFVFSAASTDVGGWNEVGSLNISVSSISDLKLVVWESGMNFYLKNFKVGVLKKMIIEGPGFCAENGLNIMSTEGVSLKIAAGVSPGSLSIELPGNSDDFEPEFPRGEYQEIDF